MLPVIGLGQDKNNIPELEQSLAGKLEDSVRLKTLMYLADFYKSGKTTRTRAESYVSQAFRLAHEKKLEVPYTLHWINATILRSLEMPEKAAAEMKIVISMLEAKQMYPEAAKARNYLASVILFSGRMNESIDLYRQNISYAKAKNLSEVIPNAHMGIASVYSTLKKYDDEKTHLQLSLEQAQKENNQVLEAMAWYRLGRCYSTVDSNFSKAIHSFNESFKIQLALKDSIQMMAATNNIGWNYYLAKQRDSSLFYYFRSLQYCPLYHVGGFANIYENIGNIYRDKKDYVNALKYYNLCESFCVKTNDLYNLAWLNRDMSDMYITMGEFKRAYEHFVKYHNLNDSLNTRKYDMGLAYARTRYETETREKELQLLTLKLNQHELFLYGFVGFIVLLIVIGVLVYYQMKNNAKRKISEMNNKLSEITHANLRQQMNPHFIFNTLNSIQYYMYQHDKIATNNYLTKFSRLIRKILENSQLALVSLKDELDVIQLYLELETLRFKDKFTFEIILDDDIDTLTYKIPAMLIQPYVENAVCHGLINKPDNGLLIIQMKICDQHICCTIQDNGIGREAAMEIQKQKESTHNSLGTKITESRIKLTNQLYGTDLKVIYTDLKDSENQPAGTLVELHLPIMT
jgi:tetratricopeptide (TPR) repeat protein